MQKLFLVLGSILGGLSVAIGAFGAHGLKDLLIKNNRTDVFETAVKYQFYHAFAILIVGLLFFKVQHDYLNYAGYAFLIGIIIFSGSLYILSLTNIGWLGAITPIGGVAFIAGWVFLTLAINKTF